MQTAAVLGWALVGAALALAVRPIVVQYAAASKPAAEPPPYGALEAVTATVFAALAYRFGDTLTLRCVGFDYTRCGDRAEYFNVLFYAPTNSDGRFDDSIESLSMV